MYKKYERKSWHYWGIPHVHSTSPYQSGILMRGRSQDIPLVRASRANFTPRGLVVVAGRYRNCTKISISLRTFLKRCKSACGCTNVPPARICISEPRTGQVDIRDQQSAHSRVHSMSYRWKSARGGCDTGVCRTGLVVSSHVFRRVSNIQR